VQLFSLISCLKDYYTVSGQHYIRNLPKSDVRLILVVVLAIVCAIQYAAQYEKYKRAVNYLRTATLNNLSLKEGGSKQTLELYRRATEMYDEFVKERKLLSCPLYYCSVYLSLLVLFY